MADWPGSLDLPGVAAPVPDEASLVDTLVLPGVAAPDPDDIPRCSDPNSLVLPGVAAPDPDGVGHLLIPLVLPGVAAPDPDRNEGARLPSPPSAFISAVASRPSSSWRRRRQGASAHRHSSMERPHRSWLVVPSTDWGRGSGESECRSSMPGCRVASTSGVKWASGCSEIQAGHSARFPAGHSVSAATPMRRKRPAVEGAAWPPAGPSSSSGGSCAGELRSVPASLSSDSPPLELMLPP